MNMSLFNTCDYLGVRYVPRNDILSVFGENYELFKHWYEGYKGFKIVEGPTHNAVKLFCDEIGYDLIIREKVIEGLNKIIRHHKELPIQLLFSVNDKKMMTDEEYLYKVAEELEYPLEEVMLHISRGEDGKSQMQCKFVCELSTDEIMLYLQGNPCNPFVYMNELENRR